jgi:hypothetical protein
MLTLAATHVSGKIGWEELSAWLEQHQHVIQETQ